MKSGLHGTGHGFDGTAPNINYILTFARSKSGKKTDLSHLVQRDKGKNLRRCTKTAVVVRQVLSEDQPLRSAPCGRLPFDRGTERWLSFASKSREALCSVVVVVEPLSSPSDRPASPSNCDFWQRVDPFDSGYYHCWEPGKKKK